MQENKWICGKHGQQVTYLCKDKDCDKASNVICRNHECMMEHCHGTQLNLISVEQLTLQIKQHKDDKERGQKIIRDNLLTFQQVLKEKLCLAVTHQLYKRNIVEKVEFGTSNLTTAGVQAFSLIEQGRYQDCSREGLVQVVTVMERQLNDIEKGTKVDDLVILGKQIEKKMNCVQQYMEKVYSFGLVKQLFEISQKKEECYAIIPRFSCQTDGVWTSNSKSIDAIQFTPQIDIQFMGYLHFKVTEIETESSKIKIKIKIVDSQTKQQIRCEDVSVGREQAMQDSFEVLFGQPIPLKAGRSYSLLSQNLGDRYSSRKGGWVVLIPKIKTSKSQFDVNGTDTDKGQFKAFILSEPL